jgi:predicted nucleic acid-binding protein
MPRYVVDASVATKWYFEEEHSTDAARLLSETAFDLLAPDLIRVEVAAAAWKRVVRAEIEAGKAEEIFGELIAVPLELTPTVDLVSAALAIALQVRRSVYDSIYLAHAIRSGAPLVTGDRKLFDAIKAGPLSAHVAWIGDLPPSSNVTS